MIQITKLAREVKYIKSGRHQGNPFRGAQIQGKGEEWINITGAQDLLDHLQVGDSLEGSGQGNWFTATGKAQSASNGKAGNSRHVLTPHEAIRVIERFGDIGISQYPNSGDPAVQAAVVAARSSMIITAFIAASDGRLDVSELDPEAPPEGDPFGKTAPDDEAPWPDKHDGLPF